MTQQDRRCRLCFEEHPKGPCEGQEDGHDAIFDEWPGPYSDDEDAEPVTAEEEGAA